MRANGEQLNKKPRIELSTIHAPKGGEWIWETEAREKADVIKEELAKE